MVSQNQLKHLRSLSIKKYRQQSGQFLVEGEKMVTELLSQTQIACTSIYGLNQWVTENERLLKPYRDKCFTVTDAELEKISALITPNKVLAVATIPQEMCNVQLAESQPCFYLDGIQDPGNMGSILRVADWFGFPAVFCSPDCVDVYSPKVVQASMGAIFRIKTWEVELSELLEKNLDLPVAGAVLDGQNVFEQKLPKHGLLVIGNEGKGISQKNMDRLTHRISIPKHASGGAESLNAAVASGILAAAFRR